MPRKRDYDRTCNQKINHTFYTRLMFSGQRHSLTKLPTCWIAPNKRFYGWWTKSTPGMGGSSRKSKKETGTDHMERPRNLGAASGFNEKEIELLQMCHAFTSHLLGPTLFEEAAQALWKSQSLLPEGRQMTALPFASFRPGSIDYTPHQETMRRLLRLMANQSVQNSLPLYQRKQA